MSASREAHGRARERRLPKAASATLNDVFGALSDPTRRAMLVRLARGECSVTALSAPFRVSAPAISKHLRVLQRAGLIDRRKAGRVHYCRIRAGAFAIAGDWIAEQQAFWERQLESLARHLGEPT